MKLVLRNITKRFGSLVANDQISLEVLPGEVHCLLGENGAGKSTLMNVLYGLYQADEGEIVLDDVVQHFSGPGDAMAAGIGMVHQHFMLIPVFTVTENVMLGNESTGFAGTLNAETDELMDIMRQLKEAGKAIVFITHKLREVRAVADRITVIRRGAVVGEASPTATNAELAALMVGRPVELTVHKDAPHLGEESLVVQDLRVVDAHGQVHLDGITFSIHAGEVLAVAGVQGNGQTELTEALLGLQDHVEGSITLDGQELVGRSVRHILDAGVGFIPEDRQADGLVGGFSIAENLMLNRSFRSPFVRRGTLHKDTLEKFAREKLDEYDVRAPDIYTHADKLSGGNQQKVVVARELSRDLRLLVAAQPTRGVDVGSIEFIHKQVIATRDSQIPVLVVSTELDEVVALADRIMVLYRGRVIGIVPGNTPRETLGLMMTGERPKDVVA